MSNSAFSDVESSLLAKGSPRDEMVIRSIWGMWPHASLAKLIDTDEAELTKLSVLPAGRQKEALILLAASAQFAFVNWRSILAATSFERPFKDFKPYQRHREMLPCKFSKATDPTDYSLGFLYEALRAEYTNRDDEIVTSLAQVKSVSEELKLRAASLEAYLSDPLEWLLSGTGREAQRRRALNSTFWDGIYRSQRDLGFPAALPSLDGVAHTVLGGRASESVSVSPNAAMWTLLKPVRFADFDSESFSIDERILTNSELFKLVGRLQQQHLVLIGRVNSGLSRRISEGKRALASLEGDLADELIAYADSFDPETGEYALRRPWEIGLLSSTATDYFFTNIFTPEHFASKAKRSVDRSDSQEPSPTRRKRRLFNR